MGVLQSKRVGEDMKKLIFVLIFILAITSVAHSRTIGKGRWYKRHGRWVRKPRGRCVKMSKMAQARLSKDYETRLMTGVNKRTGIKHMWCEYKKGDTWYIKDIAKGKGGFTHAEYRKGYNHVTLKMGGK